MFLLIQINLLNLQSNINSVCKKFDLIFTSLMLMRELILYISYIWKKDARGQFLLVNRNLSAVWTTKIEHCFVKFLNG
jgi:hypothetical protein